MIELAYDTIPTPRPSDGEVLLQVDETLRNLKLQKDSTRDAISDLRRNIERRNADIEDKTLKLKLEDGQHSHMIEELRGNARLEQQKLARDLQVLSHGTWLGLTNL